MLANFNNTTLFVIFGITKVVTTSLLGVLTKAQLANAVVPKISFATIGCALLKT
jgi:hypothetical protein